MSQFDYERDPKSGDMVPPDEPAEVARRIRKQKQEVKLLRRVAEAADEACDCGLAAECSHKPNCHVELYTAITAWREGK